MNKRNIGSKFESVAIDYIKKNGLDVIATNYKTRFSEIDIIAKDKDCLVFIEVKYRNSLKYGNGLEAIGKSKQQKIRIGANLYINENQMYDIPCRFDCIGIQNNEIIWIKDAF